MAVPFSFPDGKAGNDLLELIDKAVVLRNEQDVLKEDIDQLAADAKDVCGIGSGDFKKYVSLKYDAMKAIETIETLEQKLDDLGIDTSSLRNL